MLFAERILKEGNLFLHFRKRKDEKLGMFLKFVEGSCIMTPIERKKGSGRDIGNFLGFGNQQLCEEEDSDFFSPTEYAVKMANIYRSLLCPS